MLSFCATCGLRSELLTCTAACWIIWKNTKLRVQILEWSHIPFNPLSSLLHSSDWALPGWHICSLHCAGKANIFTWRAGHDGNRMEICWQITICRILVSNYSGILFLGKWGLYCLKIWLFHRTLDQRSHLYRYMASDRFNLHYDVKVDFLTALSFNHMFLHIVLCVSDPPISFQGGKKQTSVQEVNCRLFVFESTVIYF